ncbi:MAG: polyketide cyclase [Bacteroidetes bacterium]|nr:MAG: polyketide cyclase [Bacteroidota bacterium]REK07568.1 MAG: polyketide cyclase [Bacteroidota bacterium]REK36999.1 MAG: polyketide cyclase [Bacteroidota bacterium]REK47820.1 MAG: polyketide cyclase [Bacteroidota bacterium]
MKKALKYLGITILVLIAIPLILGLFVSKDFMYEKSISINSPIDSVWTHVSTLAAIDGWSPWNDYDPSMKKEMTGTDGEIGASHSWESPHEKVGKGSQTISKIEKPVLIETDLKFYVPYESEAKGYIKLAPEGEGTKVTWGFSSVMPYPFNVMSLFMDMSEMMDPDFTKGLAKLKDLCEN